MNKKGISKDQSTSHQMNNLSSLVNQDSVSDEDTTPLDHICSIRELDIGDTLTVLEYEKKNGLYGMSYKLKCSTNNKIIYCWSNKYITDFISTTNPKRKFNFTIQKDGMVKIEKYSTKVVLK